MSTSDSSVELRAMVDAVATARHENAFQLLDLHRATVDRATARSGHRFRAEELAATLAEMIDQLDPPPVDRPHHTPTAGAAWTTPAAGRADQEPS